jgi:Sel1 repeat
MRGHFTLGQLYYGGKGTARNYGEANRWFRKVAASRSDPEYRVWGIDAQLKLARLCYKGEGVTRDRVQALMWVTIALKHYRFAEGAEELQNQIVLELTPAEIAEAERRAKTWLESHAS